MSATSGGTAVRPPRAPVAPGRAPAPPMWRRCRLLAICVALPVLELVALWAAGAGGDRALAVQVTAPAPWDVFADLRWELVVEDSWWALALEAAGFLVLRTLLDTVIVWAAWPSGVVRPGWRRQLLGTGLFVLACELVLLPWTVIGFGVDVVPISWLFFAAVPPVVVVVAVVHHGAVRSDWWRRRPPARSVGWVLLTFLATTATGAVVGAVPAALWVPVVALGGVFNAWAWAGVVSAVTGSGARRFAPVGPGIAVGMVAVAVLGATLSFQLLGASSSVTTPALSGGDARGSGPPVLLVGGFDSELATGEDHPVPGPWDEVRFSYAGLSASGAPLPYTAATTHQSLGASVRAMAAEVEALHRSSGRDVALVAESEGSLVARTYLATDPGAPIDRVILLSPLDQPARVFYPAAGQQGYGVLTGYALGALTGLLGGISPVDLPADSPFLRSIVDHAGELRDLLDCPTGPPEALLEPLADAVADPVGPGGAVPAVVVPAFHGGLLTDPSAQRDVDVLLSGGTVRADASLVAAERIIRLAAGPWQVPALPLSLDGGADHPSCAAMESDVAGWID